MKFKTGSFFTSGLLTHSVISALFCSKGISTVSREENLCIIAATTSVASSGLLAISYIAFDIKSDQGSVMLFTLDPYNITNKVNNLSL